MYRSSKIFRTYRSDKGKSWLLVLPRKIRTFIRLKLGIPLKLKSHPLLGQNVILRQQSIMPGGDENWLRACFAHTDNFFDIGANVGYTAVVAQLIGHVKEMILVEPNPVALAGAAEHLIYNNMVDNVRFVCAFAGEMPGQKVKFWTYGSSPSGSIYKTHHYSIDESSYIEVPTVSVDSLIERYGLLPDFVKIDVEGAEAKVLAGAGQCAAQMKTRFMVEMHSNPDLSMFDNASQVINWSKSVNYQVWHPEEAARIDNPEQLQHLRRCYLLLQPITWPYPDWLRDVSKFTRD